MPLILLVVMINIMSALLIYNNPDNPVITFLATFWFIVSGLMGWLMLSDYKKGKMGL